MQDFPKKKTNPKKLNIDSYKRNPSQSSAIYLFGDRLYLLVSYIPVHPTLIFMLEFNFGEL